MLEINVTAYKHSGAEFRKKAWINNTTFDGISEIRSSWDANKTACFLQWNESYGA